MKLLDSLAYLSVIALVLSGGVLTLVSLAIIIFTLITRC